MTNARDAAMQTMRLSHQNLGKPSRDMHEQMKTKDEELNEMNNMFAKRQNFLLRNQNK